MTDHQTEADFSELTEMIQARLDIIEERIEELNELRKIRTRLTTMLHAANPESKPKSKPKGSQPSEDLVLKVMEWLQTRRLELSENGGFRVADLIERDDFNLTGPSSLAKAMEVLHEQGVVTLDHWLKGPSTAGNPRGKFWKVV